MREIKFKVWDKVNNCWFKPTYEAYKGNLEDIHINLDGSIILRHINSISHESTFLDRFIKVQYTGLKDKNGKEIYEGDIISHLNIDRIKTNGIIHFDWRGACIIVKGNYIRIDMIKEWEIIDNIYENPELEK